MSELNQGDKVRVSNGSLGDAANQDMVRVFVVKHEGLYYCEQAENAKDLTSWEYAVKIPEQKITPFTAESFPLGEVWVMNQLQDVSRSLIAGVSVSGIYNNDGFTSFEDLLDIYTISLDGGKTWQVAGIEESV